MTTSLADLDNYLDTQAADYGLTPRAWELVSRIPGDEETAYKYFVNVLIPETSSSPSDEEETKQETTISTMDDVQHAARSFRAMNILKQDMKTNSSLLIKNPTQAGLLAKDLLHGLAKVSTEKRYSTIHIRELLDALLEAFPEKVMGAASAGGKQGVQDHLGPLLTSDHTLPILTHLVCYGCTGRKGIASAEKSAQHTAMYHHMQNDAKNKISMGQRRKFVKAMTDFHLLDQLSNCLASTIMEKNETSAATTADESGEELCETILTILEVVGYPPEDPPMPGQPQTAKKDDDNKEEMVGEDILLAPLATPTWWKNLLETVLKPGCTYGQREAIARVCHHAFGMATGSSSRICKSHAPATDATEQTTEEIVEEKEEKVKNRLVEWGLTHKMHAALVTQLPLLIEVLRLPTENITDHQATLSSSEVAPENEPVIRHPGRYQTVPLGSWRLQLLSLLKEILVYRSKASSETNLSVQAMDAIMALPLPPEIQKAKKGKGDADIAEDTKQGDDNNETIIIYNPWPVLCSFVWAYPHNDFYHIIFFQMLQAAVLEHHEATLRLVLQKCKFLSRAVKSLETRGPLTAILMNCLNLLHLRSESLPPSAFLAQYLSSHDGWKASIDNLTELTLQQQKPIKPEGDAPVDLKLGSSYAAKLGLGDVTAWDPNSAGAGPDDASHDQGAKGDNDGDNDQAGGGGGKKNKKKNKKKKKK